MTVSRENLSAFRKYFFEVCIFALAFCVAYLFNQNSQLNEFIRSEMRKTLQENTDALHSLKETLRR